MRMGIILLLFLSVFPADKQFAAAAGEIVAPYFRSNNFSGVILADRAGRTLLHRAYGLADVENNVPMTADARLYIASLSKMFTAAAILQLRDAGKLSLDDPLSRFISDF